MNWLKKLFSAENKTVVTQEQKVIPGQ